MGLASVLVPSPNVTDNHQEGNARGLESVGAAVVVVEKDLDVAAVAEQVAALMTDPTRLTAMGERPGRGRPDTVERVADLLEEVARQGWPSGAGVPRPQVRDRRPPRRRAGTSSHPGVQRAGVVAVHQDEVPPVVDAQPVDRAMAEGRGGWAAPRCTDAGLMRHPPQGGDDLDRRPNLQAKEALPAGVALRGRGTDSRGTHFTALVIRTPTSRGPSGGPTRRPAPRRACWSQSPLGSPLKGRPVRLAPLRPGAATAMSSGASAGPKGRPGRCARKALQPGRSGGRPPGGGTRCSWRVESEG